MKHIIIEMYKQRWGNIELPEINVQAEIVKDTLEYFYETHYKRAKIDDWILAYHRKNMENEKGNAINRIEGSDDNQLNSSRKRSESKKKVKVTLPQEASKEIQGPKIIIRKSAKLKTDKYPDIATLVSLSSIQRDKKKIKPSIFFPKQKSFDDGNNHKEAPLETFDEFKKIPLMVKNKPGENPEIQDMNRVLANKIQHRYCSTERFVRIDHAIDNLGEVNHDLQELDQALMNSKRLLMTKEYRAHVKQYPEEKLQIEPILEIKLKEKLINRNIREERERHAAALKKFLESQKAESKQYLI